MAFSFGNVAGGGAGSTGAGGVQVAEGPELELIQTEGLGFLSLAGETKLQFASKWSEPPLATASLISIASRKGLVAAAGPDSVNIATTDSVRKAITSEDSSKDDDNNVRPFTPQITIPMSMRVSQLAFTADENFLILSAETGGGLAVYEVQALLSGAEPKSAFELSTNGETVRSLIVNPMADKAELCALVTTNGNLLMADLQQRSLRNGPSGQPVLRSQVSSAAWSSRGKQLVAGCADGSVYQMTPDGQEKAHIPKPPSVGDFYVASISWLENDVFLVVHNPTAPGDPSTYHIITRNAKANPPELVFQTLNDPVEPFSDKTPHHTVLRLRDFPPNLQDVLLVASTAVENIGLLTRSKSPLASNMPADKITNVFTTTELADDSRRAQLPMSADYSETYPVGAALDLSSTDKVHKPIPTDEMDESPGPLPGLWVLNNEGVLLAWWVVYNESIREGTTFPGLAAVDGGASATASTPAPAAAFSGGPFSSPKPAAPAFGVSATPASPAPAFGASAWGQPAASAASPSRAPAFGAPSVLGGSAFGAPSGLAAAKPSVWGSAAKTTSGPAFGQTSFGTPASSANAFSSFANNSAASPFGSAAPAASPDKPAAASPFGAFGKASESGFASLSTAKTNGSIFGSGSSSNKPFGSASNGTSAFGAALTGGSAFAAPSTSGSAFGAPKESGSLFSKPAATTSGSGASPFGSTPFVLGTTFKADPKTANDNEKAPERGSGGGMFGGGFGLSLADAAQKEPAPAPAPAAAEKDEDMDTTASAEPAKAEALAPPAPAPAASLESTTPTTTPAPAGSRFFNPLTSSDKAAPATSLFGGSKTAGAGSGSTSLFGSKPSGATSTPNPFSGFSKPAGEAPTATTPSLFGSKTPGSTAAAPSLFGKPSGEAAASPTLFGKPSGPAAAAPSLFGKPSGGASATPSLFGKPSTGAAGTGKGLFGQASSSSGMFSGFAKPAEPVKEEQKKEAHDAPLPPDTTSKAPFSLDSSSSTTPSSRLSTQSAHSAHSPKSPKSPKSPTVAPATATSPPSNNTAETPNPFSSSKPASSSEPPLPPNPFANPKKETAAVPDAPLPPDPFTKPKANSASDSSAPTAVPIPDAPLPPAPEAEAKPKAESKPAAAPSLFGSLSSSSKPASTSKPFSIFSSGATPTNDGGMRNPFANLPKEPLSPTTDGSEEDDFSDDEEEEEDEGDEEDEEDEELEEGELEGDDEDEGSGTDIGKDVSQSPTDFVKTPSFATQGSFTTVGAMDASVTSGFSHIEPSRSQIFGGPPDLRPPRQQDTSPRSPSPQRPPAKLNAGISAGRLFREESQRSFSAPGMASQLLRDSRQGRVPGSAALPVSQSGGQGGLFAGRRTARDANLEEQRKADEARVKAEAKEVPEEDSYDVMDRELDQPLPPTLQLAECLYILDSDIAGGDTVSSQVEAVYRDINRMVLVLKLNSRNIDAFLRGHSQSDRKTEDDLDDADGWVLCDVDALGAIVSRDLPTKLRQSRVKGESEILADSEALLREGSRLQVMHDDMVRVIQSQASPDQVAAARSLPLSAEQATQQNDLRRTFTKFMERLVEAEQQIVLLRTKVATLAAASGAASGANGGKAPPVPTVDAVMRTIARMTAMAEKRSGDIDVLEAQIRKLNLNTSLSASAGARGSPRREGSPFSTPQKFHQKRSSVAFAPGSTQRSGGGHRSSVMYAASPGPSAGASTPTRRKLTGYSDQEKDQLRQKRAGRQRTLDRLQKVQQSEGPRHMPMDQ
ncbi:nuclear pore complex subunit [Ophiostoma piceae UAMH 11346]|uniref:Nuclear pore complex subunit n=1 Tax=Ophiostoma piceae (strain UAMH 11346) TaxID=1262450 RepID=S3BW28_OPHP1|nr:nuclear pore complex subunit [Ophiostoma piceae UAMH 11346]